MSLLCVMVVDDSEAEQFLYKIIMKDYNPNIKILQAYDGQEAFDILDSEEQQPEIIFLDINMPGINGHDFLEVYDEREKTSTIIVMLTSSDHEKDLERSMAYQSVKGYLTKPLSTANLEEAKKLLLEYI